MLTLDGVDSIDLILGPIHVYQEQCLTCFKNTSDRVPMLIVTANGRALVKRPLWPGREVKISHTGKVRMWLSNKCLANRKVYEITITNLDNSNVEP